MTIAQANFQNRFKGHARQSGSEILYPREKCSVGTINANQPKAAQVLPLNAGIAISANRVFIIVGRVEGMTPENYSAANFPDSARVTNTKTESTGAIAGFDGDLTSMEIFRAAQAAGAFDFWDDPRDDIYSLEDGEPI